MSSHIVRPRLEVASYNYKATLRRLVGAGHRGEKCGIICRMALLSAHHLTKYFGADEVFRDLSLNVHPAERIALVGMNGCGKSTLLDILAGKLEPDEGSVHRAESLRLGYLPQVPDFAGDGTLWGAMEQVFAALRAQESSLRQLEQQMASPDPALAEAALVKYGELLHRFEEAGGFDYETRIKRTLSGLGFTPAEFERPVAQLSGGEQTRALLARLLLEEPDLLLLDEPTNHLDLAGIEWLEERLQSWRGALLVVAHDRAFLDAISDHVWELSFGKLDVYKGNYSRYLVLREERREQQHAAYLAQQRHIAETEAYIRRYKSGQRSAEARGRLKRLRRLERLEDVRHEATIKVELQATLRSGDLVLQLHDLLVGYTPDEPLLAIPDVTIRRGDRVALVGGNGSGKTTLLRTLMREIPPLRGRIRLGSAVRVGYFAQVQSHLDPGQSVIDTLLDAGMDSLAETRSFLARYGFRGEDVFKEVGVLSGGERARVALALLALQQANFLLLDEPTNHLDLPSQETLQEVLAHFDGTLLLVSHDRYLVRAIATHVWAVDEGRVRLFDSYAAYATWHQASRGGTSAQRQKASEEREAERRAKLREQRARRRALERQQAQLAALEAEIEALEARQRELSTALEIAGRAQEAARVVKLGIEYRRVTEELDRLLEQWAEVAEASL